MSARDEGAVFAYPFLWQAEKDRIENPKDRTTCLTIRKLKTTRDGVTLVHLWLLGISDNPRPGQVTVEIPAMTLGDSAQRLTQRSRRDFSGWSCKSS